MKEQVLKLNAMLKENHVGEASAKREARTGTNAAYAEELSKRPCFKIKKGD